MAKKNRMDDLAPLNREGIRNRVIANASKVGKDAFPVTTLAVALIGAVLA